MSRDYVRLVVMSAIALGGFLLAGQAARADTQMMILLDASSSMTAPGSAGTGNTKFQDACAALTSMLQELPVDIGVGLRVMGGTASADCYSSYLYLSPSTGIRSRFQDQAAAITPGGMRALYQGIEDSINDFTPNTPGDHIILAITDGGDACDRDFQPLVTTYRYGRNSPRIVIIGLDLTGADRDALGQFVAGIGGRLTEVASSEDLPQALVSFAKEFASNVRIHLQDPSGLGVQGDIKIMNVTTGLVVSETLDKADYSTTLPPGTYQITARYLGQEIQSDRFTIGPGDSKTISLMFSTQLQPFIITLTDVYGNALRAKVTFINTAGERILTTPLDSQHRVQLPPDTYTLEVRMGDRTESVYGVVIGPGQPDSREIEMPIELAVLEAEVTNTDGIPVNAHIKIIDTDGTVVDEAPNTSYLYSHLPPGTYQVIAEANNIENTQSVYLDQGEQRQVGIELNIPLGDLFVKLRTDSGNDAWGWVNVYDSEGNLLHRFAPEVAESPDWTITDLPVGIYRVEAEVDNIIRSVSGVQIQANQETEITITFPNTVQ
jgi:hypothetical protein